MRTMFDVSAHTNLESAPHNTVYPVRNDEKNFSTKCIKKKKNSWL